MTSGVATATEELDGPSLEDFTEDEEIKKAYADPEVSKAFTEIEEDPSKIEDYYENEKIKHVLELIEKKFDPYLPEGHPDKQASGGVETGGLLDSGMMEIILQMLSQNRSGQMPASLSSMFGGQNVSPQSLLDMFINMSGQSGGASGHQ